jgi:hypothetical protein
MKKSIVLFALLLIPGFLLAQASGVDRIINKYKGQEGVTVVNISPELFQVISGLDIEEKASKEFPVDKLTGLKVLAIEDSDAVDPNFFESVMKELDTEGYAEVMTVQDGEDDVKMWMKTEGQQILEFLLVVASPDENVLVYITGDFNLNDIEGLAESMGNMSGLEDLDIEID